MIQQQDNETPVLSCEIQTKKFARANVVAPWIKPLFVMLASHIRVPVEELLHLQLNFLLTCLRDNR